MGPRHRDEDVYAHLNDILAQKDEQISELKRDVATYALQSSALHGRLLATVDALDRAKLQHADELAAERGVRKNLNVQLRAHILAREEAEAERDDLRSAVLELVEKGTLFSVRPAPVSACGTGGDSADTFDVT
ncbi:hypothetical protein OF83DRAFT_730599 [Amylostereum chailletii]|nr:hypothetical protein OF83DRAFT_730599 [Amylostereum chailletii]